jgi:hypothetical protein
MGSRRETTAFAAALLALIAVFFHESLFGGKVLSPADVLLVEASFQGEAKTGGGGEYEPQNRLLMDPVLQFQPWLEFNRSMLRQGRLPLWNPHAGCGVPHLANGQSAVFDPFNLIAYAGTVDQALGPMAALRLWTAGLGMFLLARAWGAGFWGRWFAGLVYPFCGFLIVWLLYPVTPVAIWLPWLLLATDRVLFRPSAGRVGWLALVVGLVLVGGHIQTSAHVLLAAGLFALWRGGTARTPWRDRWQRLGAWSAGIVLGLALAAAQIIPLGFYLAKSRVWGDRRHEMKSWQTLVRPRWLDAVCTVFPYAYGSQRRGHPNLARGLGVNNLNESAGGYTGLATLIWLAPLALDRRGRRSEIVFLAALGLFGTAGALRLPPLDNLLRALPVLEVTDNRRLALWVAFSLSLLGGFGLESLARGSRVPRGWIAAWLVAALVMGGIASAAPRLEPRLRERAECHYRDRMQECDEATATRLEARVRRQVQAALAFIPRYYGLAASELLLLASLAAAGRRNNQVARRLPGFLLALTLVDLFGFGMDLNPSIPAEIQHLESPVIGRLRARLKPGERALGCGEELPPNVLSRYGLDDPRNYDSVELARSLNWFEPLFEPSEEPLSSRRRMTWAGVRRARERLEESSVAAVVAATAPPADAFPNVERAGQVFISWLNPRALAESQGGGTLSTIRREPGRIELHSSAAKADLVVIRETDDPGWRAHIDGAPAPLIAEGTFLAISVPAGDHLIVLEYEPPEIFYAIVISALGVLGTILALTDPVPFWIPGISNTGLGRTQAPGLESSCDLTGHLGPAHQF